MLVRDEDGVQLFGVFVNGGEASQDVALAEAGIDEDASLFGADEGGISRAAGGEDADFDYDKPPLLDCPVAHALLRAAFTLV
jgi:hypothetical protein